MKQFIKNFNNLIKKTIFKVENKTNTIFKVENKKNNNFKISSFNKYLIFFISLLFFYLFYLLIPLLYDKNWVQKNIEKKFLTEFKINLSTSANISYRILPAPHFLIKDSTILIDNTEKLKSIAEIKTLRVFIKQKNFANKEKLSLKKVVINNANFSLTRSDIVLLNEFSNNQFSSKKIKISNSKIFFKDHLNEAISIIKIDNAIFFFDKKKILNLFNLEGEVYAVPFTFDFKNNKKKVHNKEISFKAKSLMLNIFNQSNEEQDGSISGKNIISFLNSSLNTKYNLKEKLIIIESDNSMIKNSKINYNGKMSINPFDINLNIDLGNKKISKLFNINPILIEFVKSKLLFNDNISINIFIVANSNIKNEIFQNLEVNFSIINGKVNFDNTKFLSNSIGSIKLSNSDLYSEDNDLILNSDILIDIKNLDNLFSFLKTNKLLRKKIKNIFINFDYNLSTKQIKFNSVKIDKNKANNQMWSIIERFSDANFNNLNKSRVLINELFKFYEG